MNTSLFLYVFANLMSDVTDQGNRIEEDGVLNLTGENYEKTI